MLTEYWLVLLPKNKIECLGNILTLSRYLKHKYSLTLRNSPSSQTTWLNKDRPT